MFTWVDVGILGQEKEKGEALSRFRRQKLRLRLPDETTHELIAAARGPWVIYRDWRSRLYALAHQPTRWDRVATHRARAPLAALSESLDQLGNWDTAKIPARLKRAAIKYLEAWQDSWNA
jgi:hypothetical protein